MYDLKALPDFFVIAIIARHVARLDRLSVWTLTSRSRKRKIVTAQNIALHISRHLTDATLEEIGLYFSRGHPRVKHAIKSVQSDRGLISRAKVIRDQLISQLFCTFPTNSFVYSICNFERIILLQISS